MKSFKRVKHRALAAYAMNQDRVDDYHWQHNLNHQADRAEFERQIEQGVRAEFETLPDHAHTVIVSSEHLHSRIQHASEVRKILDLFSPYCSDIWLMCYLRPQIKLATSRYSTKLRNGESRSLEAVLSQSVESDHYYDFASMLALWAEHIEKQHISLYFYGPSELIEGDIVMDFISRTGLPDLPYRLPLRRNQSLSKTGQKIYRFLNRIMPFDKRKGIGWVRRWVITKMDTFFSGTGHRPDPHIARAFQSRYAESNARLQQEWFPDRQLPDNWLNDS